MDEWEDGRMDEWMDGAMDGYLGQHSYKPTLHKSASIYNILLYIVYIEALYVYITLNRPISRR